MLRVVASVALASELADAVRTGYNTNSASMTSAGNVLARITGLMQEGMQQHAESNAFGRTMESARTIVDRSDQEVTPGVKGGLDDALDKVIAEMQTKVDALIKQAHSDDQTTINNAVDTLSMAATDLVGQKSKADSADAMWIGCVGSEHGDLKQWEAEQQSLKGARSDQIEPCQQEADAEPFAWTAEVASLTCDLSQDAGCANALQEFNDQTARQLAAAESSVTAATEKHLKWKTACTEAKDAVSAQSSTTDIAEQDWLDQRQLCSKQSLDRASDICEFQTKFDNKCKLASDLTKKVGELVQQENDRVKEFITSQTVQCMMVAVKEGKALDNASLEACEKSFAYNTDVGSLDPKQAERAAHMVGEKFTCEETSVSFSGSDWKMPASTAEASSSEYTKVEFVPELPLAMCSE